MGVLADTFEELKSAVMGLPRIDKIVKDFDITARQETGDKIIETCVVLVEDRGEKIIYLLRRKKEKRSTSLLYFVFDKSDAVLMLNLFKTAMQSM